MRPGIGLHRGLRGVAATLLAAAVAGCARPSSPPGGDEDFFPPEVASTRPDSAAVVEPFRDPVVLRFDERISERPVGGRLGDAVQVSPRTSEVRVEHARDALEVELVGGFEGGLVYTIHLLPVVQDMFGNALAASYTLVFSTGPEIPETLLAGVVTDRINGTPAAGILVEAFREGDAVPYVGRTDEEGLFTIHHVPPGSYRIVAYQDRDRNLEVGGSEPRDSAVARVEAPDTALVGLRLLQPDTLAARLARIETPDSAVLRLVFDDYLPAEGSLETIRVRLSREAGGSAPAVEEVMRPRRFEEWKAERERIADSIRAAAADTATVDTAATADTAAVDTVAPDTAGAAGQGLRGEAGDTLAGAGPAGADTTGRPTLGRRPLPVQELFAVLDGPLAPRGVYQVEVTGVVNVNGLRDGGGTATVAGPEPPPDTASADTTSSDTTAADTAGAPPPDTSGLHRSGTGDRRGPALRELLRVRSRTGSVRPPPEGARPDG